MLDSHLLRTLARGSDSRKEYMIITVALALACVINGDTITGVLEEMTRLTIVITILVVVRVLAGAVERRWPIAKSSAIVHVSP
jgi:hypothetical protein